jgi:hypothetical protein
MLSDIQSINNRLATLPPDVSKGEFASEMGMYLVEYQSPVYYLGERYKYEAPNMTLSVILEIHKNLEDFISKLELTSKLKHYLTEDNFGELLYEVILYEEGLHDLNPDINLSELVFSV